MSLQSGGCFFDRVFIHNFFSLSCIVNQASLPVISLLLLYSGGCPVDRVFIHSFFGSLYTTSSHLRTRFLLAELFLHSGLYIGHRVAISSITWLFSHLGLHIHLVLAELLEITNLHLLLHDYSATTSSSSSGKVVLLREVTTSVEDFRRGIGTRCRDPLEKIYGWTCQEKTQL